LDRRKPQERNRHLRFNINRYERHGYWVPKHCATLALHRHFV